MRIRLPPSAAARLISAALLSTVAVFAAGCTPVAHAPARLTLDGWVARDAVPFSLDAGDRSARNFDAAVDAIVGSLGDQVELLGLGEAMHGGEDILTLRNRLFQRLVAAHSYSAIAIETGFDAAYPVNEYVAGRGPASYEQLLDGAYGRGFGRLEANRELVEWMRAYNADPARSAKLSFYGFDLSMGSGRIAGPAHVLAHAVRYLESVGGESARAHRQRVDALLAQASGWEEAWTDRAKAPGRKPVGDSLRIATEDLITELRTRRPELVATTGSARYLEALHYATVARNVLVFHAALAISAGEPLNGTGLRGARDVLMADNLTYLVERERGRGKLMVFAHNGHLQRGKSVWPCCGLKLGNDRYEWWPAGSQLAQTFGRRYAVIGSGVGISQAYELDAPEPGSIEALLTRGTPPSEGSFGMFIPTHLGQSFADGAVAPLPTRSGTMKNLSYTALTPQSFTDFDWLHVLESARQTRQIPGGAARH